MDGPSCWAAIDREHSITKAAKTVGMSYRRAWTMIQEVNAAAGETLVEAAVGGTKGGGARLTPRGRLAIDVYEQVRQSLVETAAGALRQTVAPRASAIGVRPSGRGDQPAGGGRTDSGGVRAPRASRPRASDLWRFERAGRSFAGRRAGRYFAVGRAW